MNKGPKSIYDDDYIDIGGTQPESDPPLPEDSVAWD